MVVGFLIATISFVLFASWQKLRKRSEEVPLSLRESQRLLAELEHRGGGIEKIFYSWSGKFGERDYQTLAVNNVGNQIVVAVPQPDKSWNVLGVCAGKDGVWLDQAVGLESEPDPSELSDLSPKSHLYEVGEVELKIRSLGQGEALLFEMDSAKVELKSLIFARNFR